MYWLELNKETPANYLLPIISYQCQYLVIYLSPCNNKILVLDFITLCFLLRFRVKCSRVYRLGVRSVAVSLLAIFCWVMDRMFCDAWLSIDFPYMHGVWHVLIFIASYTALVLFAYFNATEESPEQKPQLKYWPVNEFELGIPYVTMKHPFKTDKNLAI